tara:strand:+ start:73 stop:1062 length:990 start_codon:yes stop_codon:yes gene_type:complete
MNKLIGFENEFKLIINNLLNNNLNSSVLIGGNKGIGKFFFINKLIEKYFNLKLFDNENNHHITLLNNNTHPNIKILKKKIDEKTNKIKKNISIEQVRELNIFINETSIIKNLPKFIIIDCADDLNLSSSNALLKILEEPKSNTYFFLISHQPSSLLPTIKSRCLKINLQTHKYTDFKKILNANNFNSDDELFYFLFDITNGSPGLAFDYNFDKILEIFNHLVLSLNQNLEFSALNNDLINLFSKFDDDKFRIYLSLVKFTLIIFKKIKMGIDIKKYYLSKNILDIRKYSDKINEHNINNKLDYLINNENDLFTFNLDKKNFMINFFSEK